MPISSGNISPYHDVSKYSAEIFITAAKSPNFKPNKRDRYGIVTIQNATDRQGQVKWRLQLQHDRLNINAVEAYLVCGFCVYLYNYK